MKALPLSYLIVPEEDDDCCYYYDCSEHDLFNSRALPFVIGTEEFINSGDAGLGDEEEDVGGYESEKSDYGEYDPEGEVNYNEVRKRDEVFQDDRTTAHA